MAAKRKKLIKSRLQPTAGYVAIKPLEPEKKTASGIYLPESSGEKSTIGKITAVGPEEITDSGAKKKSPVKIGDIVIYKKYGGNAVVVDNEEFLFAKFEDILAVLKK